MTRRDAERQASKGTARLCKARHVAAIAAGSTVSTTAVGGPLNEGGFMKTARAAARTTYFTSNHSAEGPPHVES
jgi:hypothetical protein